MKKLDVMLIRSFLPPFIGTFFVSLFVLVMQFFYIYMDDLIGKGLGAWTLLQLMAYMAATLVPIALPLGVLLASIMTLGAHGEAYELVAVKASGISLLRFLRPLFLLVCAMAVGAFFFNNNIIPIANLKAYSLLYDLRRSTPTVNIRAGQFNSDIDGFSIRVGRKDEDGQGIHDVIIYDGSSNVGNDNIVLAKKGRMMPAKDQQALIFRLQNGTRFQEGANNTWNGMQHDVQIRFAFRQWDKVIDLSGLAKGRTDEGLFAGATEMMNIRQLAVQADTIRGSRQRDIQQTVWYFKPYLTSYAGEGGLPLREKLAQPVKVASAPTVNGTSYVSTIPEAQRAKVIAIAASHVRNVKGGLDGTCNAYTLYTDNLLKVETLMHKKFTLSFACVLLFLIGAPLGAIIRKGGLGMPILVAIIFFMGYYLLSVMGERLATSRKLPPAAGMWLSTATLLPIAVLLLQQARNDSQFFRNLPTWLAARVSSAYHRARFYVNRKKAA